MAKICSEFAIEGYIVIAINKIMMQLWSKMQFYLILLNINCYTDMLPIAPLGHGSLNQNYLINYVDNFRKTSNGKNCDNNVQNFALCLLILTEALLPDDFTFLFINWLWKVLD